MTPADRAQTALDAYPVRNTRLIDTLTDFLPDLMHLCDREGLDFDAITASAKRAWAKEKGE
jgi:hypothetical protein